MTKKQIRDAERMKRFLANKKATQAATTALRHALTKDDNSAIKTRRKK